MSEIQDIKDRISLAEVIGEHIKLTATGNYLRGLCPFHHEKSPSFFVNNTLGFYKCFGCGEHGDVFDFLQKYENLTFGEALEILAKKAGVVLQKKAFDPQEKMRGRVLEILELAAAFYEQELAKSSQCQPVREYMEKRGVQQSTVKLFRLGAAADEWTRLSDYLESKKYKKEELIASGMALTNKTGRIYDRFRNRLMFPLKNHRGQVVGFSGRVMADEAKEAKYLNSPETMVYHKGRMLYGLHELNREIKKRGEILIVEGEFDVLSSVQAKVDFVTAIKGSALTSDHANVIARYVKKVILALDADRAGIEATKKAIAALRPVGVELWVVMLEAGEDPDSYARKNAAGWREKVNQPISVWEFFLRVVLGKYDVKNINEQKKILQELASVFALIDNRLEYEFYLSKLAETLSQNKEIIRQDLETWKDLPNGQMVKKMTAEKPPKPKRKLTKKEMLEAYVWFLFVQCLSEEKNVTEASEYILRTTWDNQFLQKMTEFYQQFYRGKKEGATLRDFLRTLPEDYQQKVAQLSLNQTFMRYCAKAEVTSEWQKQTRELEREKSKGRVAALSKKLAEFDRLEQLTAEQETERKEILEQIRKLKTTKAEQATENE